MPVNNEITTFACPSPICGGQLHTGPMRRKRVDLAFIYIQGAFASAQFVCSLFALAEPNAVSTLACLTCSISNQNTIVCLERLGLWLSAPASLWSAVAFFGEIARVRFIQAHAFRLQVVIAAACGGAFVLMVGHSAQTHAPLRMVITLMAQMQVFLCCRAACVLKPNAWVMRDPNPTDLMCDEMLRGHMIPLQVFS